MTIRFTVYAKPEPQGSTKAFMPKGARFPVVTSDNKNLKSYRQQVSIVAIGEMNKTGSLLILRKVPVRLTVEFNFRRPESKSKKAFLVVKPDLDKLCRAVGDALTGICYADDSQITQLIAKKHYGEPERTIIEVCSI